MLLKMLSRLPSLLLSLVLLLCIWTGATELESTITVDLEDEDARDKKWEGAPPVRFVQFKYPSGYNITNQNCTETNSTYCKVSRDVETSLNATFESSSPRMTFMFNITFDTTLEFGCYKYIPNIRVIKNDSESTVDCRPRNIPDDSPSNAQWWRFVNESVLYDFLDSSNRGDFEDLYLITSDDNGPVFTNGTYLQVNFTANTYELVGYYLVTVENLYHQEFVVYANPELKDSYEDKTLILGGQKRYRDFDKIFCQFVSFPPSTVTWDTPSKSNFTTEDVGKELVIGGSSDPDLTLNGRLMLEEVQFEDGGRYTCTATHPISGETDSFTFILRLRDHLRPLWPSLGIVAAFIITFLFISGGALFNKIRGTDTEDDEGAFQRNYSVVSNIGEEADRKRMRKHQAAGKRVSITQQELLANASDPN